MNNEALRTKPPSGEGARARSQSASQAGVHQTRNETNRTNPATRIEGPYGSQYPGGDRTFLGCFRRVRIEGRRGRSYWEWKASEKKFSRNGHEGDDELTSLEGDTLRRRVAGFSPDNRNNLETPSYGGCEPDPRAISGGVRVFPPFHPPSDKSEGVKQVSFESGPAKTHIYPECLCPESAEKLKVKSYEHPRLTPLLNRAHPPKEAPPVTTSLPLPSPSAPPKGDVYADAGERPSPRSQLAVGHEHQSVGYLEPSKYSRALGLQQREVLHYHDNLKQERNPVSNQSLKPSQFLYPRYQLDHYLREENLKERGKDSAHCITEDDSSKSFSDSYPAVSDNSLNTSKSFNNTFSSLNTSEGGKSFKEYEPETKPPLLRGPLKSDVDVTNQKYVKHSESTPLLSDFGAPSSPKSQNTAPSPRTPVSRSSNSNRKSGALVWVNQPGGGAKLEWVPTAGLSTLRAVPAVKASHSYSRGRGSQREAASYSGGVAGSSGRDQDSNTKGSVKRGDEEGGGGGASGERGGARSEKDARAGGSGRDVPRAATDSASSLPRASCGGSAARAGEKFATSGVGTRVVTPASPQQKNVYSSAPGTTRPAGRTSSLASGHDSGRPHKEVSFETPADEDKIVTVAGRSQGQVVRIRVRPEVHAYLANLPVINSSLPRESPVPDTTERRDSFQSGNSSSASALTAGSGEGSIGYQEQDYADVVDEYTLLKRAVDDQDPEALRLLTAAESSYASESGGGGEYPYLKEMKERLLISTERNLNQMSSSNEPRGHDQENQLLEVHQTPVGTVVKLNADGYGSHTSPTHRVESLYTGTLESRKTHHQVYFPKNAKTSTFITLSLLYATLLVVVCLGFVLSEVLTHNVPLYYYEAFFTYLYGMSLFFLLYVFCYLLSDSARDKKTPKNQKVRKPEVLPSDASPTQEKLTSPTPKPKKTKTSDNDHSHGTFFLRIGAIAFGLGTMIYNGLEFGIFFEIPMESPCYQILRGVNPLLQLVFTFFQMYFIFMNARLNIHKFKFVARFGLMHIVATNLCVWLRTLVRESLKEINEFRVSHGHNGEDFMIMEGIRRALQNKGLMAPNKYMYNLDPFTDDPDEVNVTDINYGPKWTTEEDLINRTCERMEIMGSIVSDSAPYLYPFIVEYSLIGASVVYIMWKHIGRNPKYIYDPEVAEGTSVASRRCHSKVDCVGASKGLFCGLLVLVATLICLILFFVLVHQEELRMLAIYLADVSHCGIMFLSLIAIFVGFARVRLMKFYGEREEELDDILLMVSAFGLFAYAVFSTVAGSLSAFTEEPNCLVMATGILSIVQVIIQMVFIKDAQRRQVALPEQERTKPGRQIVTFLLICNLAMWVIYTFETQKVEANPVQLEFFGKLSWTILLRCTLPLAIFHRFHSSVVLAAIWKNSYKTRLE